MTIKNSKMEDMDEIFRLYETAILYQQTKGAVPWAGLSREMVAKEISEKRQWKLLIDNKIACVWVITFQDRQIWGDKDNDPSIYIHRIATDSPFRGRNLVSEVVNWAKGYAKLKEKKFIRLDTVGENPKLIKYYQSCGFDFLGLDKLTNTDGLPNHYHNATVCLFEMIVS